MHREPAADARFVRQVSGDARQLLKLEEAYRIPGRHVQLPGALWHPDGFLLVADLGRDTIWFWQRGSLPKAFRRPAGGPTHLALDPRGRLIVIEKLCNTITRTEADGAVVIVAEAEDLGNNVDITAAVGDAEDNLYVAIRTESVAGFGSQKTGTLVRVTRNRKEEEFGHEIVSPSALAWDQRQEALWVLGSTDGEVWRLRRSGNQWEGEKLAQLWHDPEIDHGGIAVRQDGVVAVASEAGLYLLAEGQRVIAQLELAEPPAACSWGGPHSPEDLVVTAGCSVYIIPGRGSA